MTKTSSFKYSRFGKRLKDTLDQQGIEETKLAAKLKISRQTVYTWTSGKSVPGYETLVELSKMLKISLDFLLRGITYTSVVDEKGQTRPLSLTLRRVYSSIHLDPLSHDLIGEDPVGEYLYPGDLPEHCVLFNVNKNNMSCADPQISINKGDIVVLDPSRKEKHGDIVLSISDDYTLYIHQIFFEESEFLLRSFNPDFPDYKADFSMIRDFIPITEVIPRSRKLI